MAEILVADAHMHSNPVSGLGAGKIAEKFRSVGGWFIALVSLPPYYYGLGGGNIESYEKTLRLLVGEAEKIKESGLKTRVLAGFHPAEVDEYFRKGYSLEQIIKLAEEVLEIIVEYHRKGLIDGIGEVGRQHYSTAPSRLVASELIMMKAMQYARDNDMIMHLHLEQGGKITVDSISELSKCVGLRKEHIFFHHTDYETSAWSEKRGYWYTVPAKKRILSKTLPENREYILIESDFIDDPRRPGVSSYPWDIAYRIRELLDTDLIDTDKVYKVMIDNIVKAYKVEPP